ncbi:hypothetical protein F8M41_018804 [Gigaspora margarita]|uniref:Uncharacterized protein n=1 Tax=Gigaspora margarita TaxID=4874 RepID=A0A8H4AL09_GIGMA|nr:hypothetical protein F8M41_018804 [Gigaspora margarita]
MAKLNPKAQKPTPYVRRLRLSWTLIIVSIPVFVSSSYVLYKRVFLDHKKIVPTKKRSTQELIKELESKEKESKYV